MKQPDIYHAHIIATAAIWFDLIWLYCDWWARFLQTNGSILPWNLPFIFILHFMAGQICWEIEYRDRTKFAMYPSIIRQNKWHINTSQAEEAYEKKLDYKYLLSHINFIRKCACKISNLLNIYFNAPQSNETTSQNMWYYTKYSERCWRKRWTKNALEVSALL